MLEIMIFGNRVATFALTGVQTKAVLESVIAATPALFALLRLIPKTTPLPSS